jgi:hypothetical protein
MVKTVRELNIVMDPLPPDLERLANAVDAADAAADAIASRVSDEELFWQPDGGRRWSIALCLDHLAVANTVYGRAIRGAIDDARARGRTRRAPASPGFFGRKFIESLEPPARRRTSAPGKIKPLGRTSRKEIPTPITRRTTRSAGSSRTPRTSM